MRFGPAERPKHGVLVDFVTTMARLLTRGGNRIGAILYAPGTVRVVPPRSGQKQVLRLIHDLLRDLDAEDRGDTDLGVLLEAALGVAKRRSLLFLVSDFISRPGWERPLSLLGRRHEVIAVRLWDSQEAHLPDAGYLYLEDAETGEQMAVDTGDPAFRRAFADLAGKREQSLRLSLRRAGVDLYAVSTDEDLVRAIIRMAGLRKIRRR
jgi:uncharacterized protein (DUF58 family)